MKVLIALPNSDTSTSVPKATLAKQFFKKFSKYDVTATTDIRETYALALGQRCKASDNVYRSQVSIHALR